MPEDELDQKLNQILNELRNTLLGVQILMAGLVAIPFSQRFSTTGPLTRTAYLVAALSTALASAFLVAPAQYHRLRWNHHATNDTLRLSSKLANLGAVFLTVALGMVVFVICLMVTQQWVAVVCITGISVTCIWLWFVLPLLRRDDHAT